MTNRMVVDTSSFAADVADFVVVYYYRCCYCCLTPGLGRLQGPIEMIFGLTKKSPTSDSDRRLLDFGATANVKTIDYDFDSNCCDFATACTSCFGDRHDRRYFQRRRYRLRRRHRPATTTTTSLASLDRGAFDIGCGSCACSCCYCVGRGG